MTDPLLPPPRRPAPDALRDRISRDLDQVSRRRFRIRYLAAPVAAAGLVAATVLGVTSFSGPPRLAEPANPSPTAGSSTPVSPDVTPTPAGTGAVPLPARSMLLDVRALTRAEIARDAAGCAKTADPDLGTVSDPTAQFARIQRRAGLDGPGDTEVRVLVGVDDEFSQSCEDGHRLELSSRSGEPAPSRKVPAVEVGNFGSVSSECGDRRTSKVTTSELYAVDDTVAYGQIRVNRGRDKGPWQLTRPADGLVHFSVEVTGEDAWIKPLSFDIQFLDRNGERMVMEPYGARESETTRTQSISLEGCGARLVDRTQQKITPPANAADALKQCVGLAYDADPELPSKDRSSWEIRLEVSSDQEWGAVLTDGKRRFGCSLYPTREVSRIVDDTTKITATAFHFAANPIAATDGTSLWAGGRVPDDVTKIDFRLPGGVDVPADLDENGYWWIQYHVDGADLATGDVADWDPVVVTVSLGTKTTTYRLPFTTETMCNQVSHGC